MSDEMNDETPDVFQTCRYRIVNGEVEARMFDSDSIPAGWYHDPGVAENPPKRRGRPPKIGTADDGAETGPTGTENTPEPEPDAGQQEPA